MNPDKVKKIGFAALGVWVLLAGGLGYLAYDAVSGRSEAEDTLESENSAFRNFNEAPVFPSSASIDSVKSNEMAWGSWYDAAFAIAGRGDKELPSETPPVFKQRLQTTVRRLQGLRGEVDGKLSAPTFFFGFEKYLGETDALPQPDDIPTLAAQLDFIEQFSEAMAEAGVREIKSLSCVVPNTEGECARHLDYVVTFSTRPQGLIKALNALAVSSRFVAISDFSFKETADSITPRLSAESSKDSTSRGRGGRRGRRASAEEEQVDASKKENRLVTEPAVNSVFDVTMTLKVYDFRQPPEDEDEQAKKKKKGAK